MDPIADMLIRIKNAQAVRHERVSVPFSKVKWTIARVLADAGYLGTVERVKRKARKAEVDYLDLALKPDAISGIRILSRPSRHVYTKSAQIRPVRSGFGTLVVSTPKGIMTGTNARKEKVGGEMMFEIW